MDWNLDETSWQMMTEWYLAHKAAGPMTVKEACITSLTNYTSATRRLSRLKSKGLVIRQPDRSDRRRTLLKLSASTYKAIDEYFGWVGLHVRSAYNDDRFLKSNDCADSIRTVTADDDARP